MPELYDLPLNLRHSAKAGRRLLLWAALLFCGSAQAAEVQGLYTAEVPVVGQQVEQRNAAIQDALRKVLVKVTGNRKVAKREALQPMIRKAAEFVQKYRYRLAPETGSSPGNAPRHLLEVQFEAQAVKRLLEQEGLPAWGANRPLILVWLGIEKEGKRVHLTPGLDRVVEGAALGVGRDRGLPMILPLMDLEDRGQLQVSDLWGGFTTTIRGASRRYQPDLIVFGRLSHVSDQLWRAHWTLLKDNGSSNWQSEGTSSAGATDAGLQEVADRLAAQSAPIRNITDVVELRMRVGGIRFLGDYERVQGYLQGLNSVEQADLLFAEPQAVIFELEVRGGRSVLEREISLGGMLQREIGGESGDAGVGNGESSGSGPITSDEEVLYYQLQP